MLHSKHTTGQGAWRMAMAEYLYRVQPARPAMLSEGPTAVEAAVVREHFAYLKRLSEDGIVILSGRTQTTDANSFGIVIFNADSDEAAEAIAENDPAVRDGVMRAEVFPYRIALFSPQNAQAEDD
jgi:uncharacterized protein YciI